MRKSKNHHTIAPAARGGCGGLGQLWEALAELWEALGELWEGRNIEKLPINRPSGCYVYNQAYLALPNWPQEFPENAPDYLHARLPRLIICLGPALPGRDFCSVARSSGHRPCIFDIAMQTSLFCAVRVYIYI